MARTVAMRKRFRSTDWTKTPRKKARTVVAVPRNQFGFPINFRTNLRYCDDYFLSASSTNTAITNAFRMNGIFDPDLTGAGHQPMWRDNYANIYQNYRVISSTIKVTFLPQPITDVGSYGPYNIGIVGASETTNPSTVAVTRKEMSDSVSRAISRYSVNDNTLFLHYTPKSKLGSEWSEDTVAALVGANPSQQYIADVWFSDMGSGVTSYLWASVEIDYVVEFFKLTLQAQN